MNFTDLQKSVLKAHKSLNSWEKVGAEFGVTKGTAYRVAHGYEPKAPAIRHALNLPAYAPAPCCPRCGVVHVSKRCTAKRQLPEPYEFLVQWLREKEEARRK